MIAIIWVGRKASDSSALRTLSCNQATQKSSGSLLVEPNLLVSPVAVDAIGGTHMPLHIGMSALGSAAVQDDRASDVLVEDTLDLPDEFPALGDIALGRLELQQLRDFRVAISRKIILGVASIALDQRGVGIIDAGPRQIESNR